VNNFEQEVIQRITRLESKVEDQGSDIKEIKEKMNGYLENKIKSTVKAMLGEILIAVITSTAFITFILSRLFRR
jgi:hypothetical protein